jgi:anti-anti-sigma regulatory factor
VGADSFAGSGARGEHVARADVMAALRSSQRMIGELTLEKVLAQTLRVVTDAVSARRCQIVLRRRRALVLEAVMHFVPEAAEPVVALGLNLAIGGREDVAQAVIQHVDRTGEAVVLSAAVEDPRFAADPYLVRRAPRSVLAVALVNGERALGVLYLENVAPGSLTRARLDLLILLAGQAAAAIENAARFGELRTAAGYLQEAVERLEQLVADRTEEVRSTSEDLRRELRQNKVRETERDKLKQDIINMHKARLREMSTPMIPITAQVMVMPLIGHVDRERARQVMEVVVRGAQRRGAKVVIIDVTGILSVDAGTAEFFMRCAEALRLLVAEAVLTGIQPWVARILVEFEVPLKIPTHRSLQDGIDYALARTGR